MKKLKSLHHYTLLAITAVALVCISLATNAAEPTYKVAAPTAGAKTAPTRVVSGGDPALWPLDYVPASVGAPCDCSKGIEERRDPLPALHWCLLKGRKGIAAACEVSK